MVTFELLQIFLGFVKLISISINKTNFMPLGAYSF